ncbi:MAG: hypothetical protein R3A46_04215 [Thermomicrobiales bacterium]
MADTQTGRLPKLGARLNQAAAERGTTSGNGRVLRCQWCSVDLPPGVTVCPTCGSSGIDGAMIVPGAGQISTAKQPSIAPKSDEELVEWWNEADEDSTYKNSSADEQDQLPVILGLVGTAIVCVALGAFVAPMLLASAFESSLGVTVDNPNDLRPLGAILGLLTGAFIGAIGMWVTAPRR